MLFCYCHDLIHFHRSKKALPLHRAIPVMSMAKDAGMILSEFILLGIGGREMAEENAIQTAKALNVIQPDFIRVHATGIKPESKMGEFVRDGSFTLLGMADDMICHTHFLFFTLAAWCLHV